MTPEQAEAASRVRDGLRSAAWRRSGTPIVGVELSSTEPSQIPWYQGKDALERRRPRRDGRARPRCSTRWPARTAPTAPRRRPTRCCRTSSAARRRPRPRRGRSPRRGLGPARSGPAHPPSSLASRHARPAARCSRSPSAALLAPALLRALAEGGHTRANYRARALPFPFGVLVLRRGAARAGPADAACRCSASAELFHPESLPVALYALGVLALGLIDDTLGERAGVGGERAARAGAARLARARRGAAARRAVDRRAEGRRLARPGAAGDELARASPTGAGCSPRRCSCSRPTCSTCSTCARGARSRPSCCSGSA